MKKESINIFIVDDEIKAIQLLQSKLESIAPFEFTINHATSVEEACQAIKKESPDLLFLDVQLIDGTGFEILNRLDEINFEIVFITAFDQYAIDAIRVNALDYLLKPIQNELLLSAITKAYKRVVDKNKSEKEGLVEFLNNQRHIDRIALKERNKIVFILMNDIIYFSADGAYTKIICEKKMTYVSSHNIGHYENMMVTNNFVRSHRSYLINVQKVTAVLTTDLQLQMTNGDLVGVTLQMKNRLITAIGG